MNIKIENVIWQFAKLYRDKFAADHPGQQMNMSVAAVATFLALKENGDAVEHADADGSVTWKATPKFLQSTGLEPGPLVIFGPGVN